VRSLQKLFGFCKGIKFFCAIKVATPLQGGVELECALFLFYLFKFKGAKFKESLINFGVDFSIIGEGRDDHFCLDKTFFG